MSSLFWNSLGIIFSYFPAWLSGSVLFLVENTSQDRTRGTDSYSDYDPEPEVREEEAEEITAENRARERSYYAVALVRDPPLRNDTAPLFILESMQEVLQVYSLHKASHIRWKRFQNRAEAERFSLENDAEEQLAIEEAMPFKAPTAQELAQLREHIEDGELEEVRELIENNPRYLIGPGDNPTVLEEECRYNALHVAAKFNRGDIMKLILEHLRSPAFFRGLYPDDDDRSIEDRICFIVDMYLNTPDESEDGEYPLHLAAKFGSLSSARFLLGQEECNQDAMNRQRKGAEEIVCEERGGTMIARRLRALFKQNFVIPVLCRASTHQKPHIVAPVTFQRLRRMLSASGWLRERLTGLIGPLTSLQALKIMKQIEDTWDEPENVGLRELSPRGGVWSLLRKVARNHEVPFRENWPFLGCALDIASESGLCVLDYYLRETKFIHGDSPSKPDYTVWCALEPVSEEITEDDGFENVKRWISDVREFPTAEMRAWKTPRGDQGHSVGPELSAEDTLIGLVRRFGSEKF